MPSGKMEPLGYMLMGTSAAGGEAWDGTVRSYMPALRHIASPQEIARLLRLGK